MLMHSEGCGRLKPLESVFLPALKRRGFQPSQELLREVPDADALHTARASSFTGQCRHRANPVLDLPSL